MKRKPSHQPFADAMPVIMPVEKARWRQVVQFSRSWLGALLVVGCANVFFMATNSGNVFSVAKSWATQGLQMFALTKMHIDKDAGAADGEALAKLNNELIALKAEKVAMMKMAEAAKGATQGLIAPSKLDLRGNQLYWQVLVRRAVGERDSEFYLAMQPFRGAIPMDFDKTARIISVNHEANLFDGQMQTGNDRFVLIGLWRKSDKKLLELRVFDVANWNSK